MTHYNLFRMAAEVMPELIMPSTPEELEQFANIVAAGEREACAAIADHESKLAGSPGTIMVCDRIAAAIRARGDK
jgi:hypothetical protein